MSVYSGINYKVMIDTKNKYETLPQLRSAVQSSIKRQYMVRQEDQISHPISSRSRTQYIVSPKRSLEAASGYPGKKVAVLNFANNHSVGGAPFSSGAQEESLCRCSTLYPCLQAMWGPFYARHQDLYNKGIINHVGNDDLIYTPDVVVFKSDERTDPIFPTMMPEDRWFKVDIITSAAPELRAGPMPRNYDQVICSRIRRILDVAANEHVEVLILGAWGCGAFRNPAETVARTFHDLLAGYDFETVEFALASDGESVFHKVFEAKLKDASPEQAAPSSETVSLSGQAEDSKEQSKRRRYVISSNHEFKCEVSFNPENRHWYLDTHSSPMEKYPTRSGYVDSSSLTQRMEATGYCSVNIDSFGPYDILFLRDDRNRIGVFTMVWTNQELGSLYRTDRKGFGYKSAILYFDTWSGYLKGAHQYLVTEDLTGRWAMVDLYHDNRPDTSGYFEFISRDKIAKGFRSEKEVLNYFKNEKNGPDLTDTERFARIDSKVPYEKPRHVYYDGC